MTKQANKKQFFNLLHKAISSSDKATTGKQETRRSADYSGKQTHYDISLFSCQCLGGIVAA